jgi:hypothetical protein
MTMPPQLVALTDGPNILLDKPIVLLGRHQECDIQLGSRKVSRRHCCLAQVHDYLVVRDLGSTNGIRINGVRVLEGSLRPGDELTIGNQRYKLQWPAQPNEPLPSQMPVLPADKAAPVGPPVDDARLESCDIPVPLTEPPGASALMAMPAPAAPPASLIVPDKLELAPLSEERRRRDALPPSK